MLNNHTPNTLLSPIHVHARGIMKADKYNRTCIDFFGLSSNKIKTTKKSLTLLKGLPLPLYLVPPSLLSTPLENGQLSHLVYAMVECDMYYLQCETYGTWKYQGRINQVL